MKPKTKTLKNGLRILFVPMKDQRTATVLVLVEAGSKYETKERNGISHFLEHMCFKGTTTRPNSLIISHELDGLGAEYNAFTGHEYTGYYAKVASRSLPQALDLIADIYCNPLFGDAEIEREKGVIADEINMYEDMPMRKVGDLFMELLYGDQPAGWQIAGTKERIRTFMREDFVKYRNKHYVPAATTVVVSGSFDTKKVEALIKQKFSGLESGKKQTKKKVDDRQSAPKLLVHHKESDQTHLVLGFRSYPLGHASYHTLAVLAGVLGGGMSSRLFHKIRTELGLGYYVRAANDAFTDHGVLAASVGADNTRIDEVIPAILEEFRKLKADLVAPSELKKVKDMLAGRLVLGLESSDELGEFYGFQEMLKKELRTPEEIIVRMNKVTAEDIRKMAKKIFVPERMNLAMIGPWKGEERFAKLLKI
jgi:predicted Zn-dependent peptidase